MTAGYARYSTELQSAASIQDQVRLCRRLCEERGWTVVEVFADEAISGATQLRPGFQQMQQAAMNGGFDLILAEAMDRLSRDQEHIAGLHKRMGFLNIRLVTKSEGEINEMHIGLGGTMSALFLKNLADKTRRGLEGRVAKGKSAGGISYGYRVVKTLREDGSVTTGDREIIAEEAETVRRIFEDYAKGLSARAIAAALNDEAIPCPGGGRGISTWGPSTIAGNARRGTGILNNELYIGRLIWNRQRFVKDPETGKRQARPNPPEDWIIEDVPHLRIIGDDLWQRAKGRQGLIREAMNPAGVRNAGLRPERAKRPVYLLSGLISCGCCGAGYTLINKTRYGCAAARAKGAAVCTNRSTITRDELEARVLGGMRQNLLHPDLVSVFIEEYRKAWNEAQASSGADRNRAKRKLAHVEKKIAGIMTAIEDGMYHPSMKDKIAQLEAEKAKLTTELAATPEPPALRLHPSLTDVYRKKVGDLTTALSDPPIKLEATEALRGLISTIRMIPDADADNGHHIELEGDIAAIMALGRPPKPAAGHLSVVGSGTVVAGARNQRYLRLVEREVPKLAA